MAGLKVRGAYQRGTILRVLRAAKRVESGGPIVFLAPAADREARTLALQGFLREDNPNADRKALPGYYITERGKVLLASLEASA